MANKWVYRPQNIYWEAQKPRKDTESLWTVDIAAPLDTPAENGGRYSQQTYYSRSLRRHAAFKYQKHLLWGFSAYSQSLGGSIDNTQITGALQVDFIGFPIPTTDNIEERGVVTHRRPLHTAFLHQRRNLIDQSVSGTLNNQGVSGAIDNTQIVGSLLAELIGFPNPYTDTLEERIAITHRSRRPHAAFFSQKKSYYLDTSVQYSQSLSGTLGIAGSAPTVVNPTSVNGSFAVAKPAGDTAGDFFVYCGYSENGSGSHSMTGWNKIDDDFRLDPGSGINQCVSLFWRERDGTEGSTFAANSDGSSYQHAMACIVRGATAGQTPLGGIVDGIATGTTLTVTGITTTQANAIAIVMMSMVQGGVGTTPAMPGGWTSDLDFDAHTGRMWHQAFAAIGATGSQSLTFTIYTGPSAACAAGMIGFQPTGAPGMTGALQADFIPGATQPPYFREQYAYNWFNRTRHPAYAAQMQARQIEQQRQQLVSINLTGAFP